MAPLCSLVLTAERSHAVHRWGLRFKLANHALGGWEEVGSGRRVQDGGSLIKAKA